MHTRLSVHHCQPSDAGKYTVKADNKAGHTEANFEVKVRGEGIQLLSCLRLVVIVRVLPATEKY